MSYILETFRYKGYILIFTLPQIDFLDTNTRKMLDAQFEPVGIDRTAMKVHLKPKLLQWNPKQRKTYERFLRVTMAKGKTVKLKDWGVGKPSAKLWKEYSKKKNEFTSKLYKEIRDDIVADKMAKNPKKEIANKELTHKQRETYDLMKTGMTVEEVAAKQGVAVNSIYERIKYATKKGYDYREAL